MNNTEIYAFTLTLLAGLATLLGSLIALFAKRKNKKLLAGSLGFSAGVMIYVAMAELFIKSKDYLINANGEMKGNVYVAAAFFGGMIFIGLIDYLVPTDEGDIGNIENNKKSSLRKMSILTTVAIAIHNFPEGMVTFASTLSDIKLGIMIAFAIAIHNIPEGIATALPIFFSSGNRKKAFILSAISGVTEPIGAILGYTILKPFLDETMMGILFGVIAGIMMFISLEELLPMAREYEKSKLTIITVVIGMVVMALSLIMFL